jgi:hypothetical protein
MHGRSVFCLLMLRFYEYIIKVCKTYI